VHLGLRVDVIDGAWHWRCVAAWVRGWRIPLWLLGRTAASKRVVDGRYRFNVDLSLPVFGRVLSYGGDLVLRPQADPAEERATQ
jgi:hypothetical protein